MKYGVFDSLSSAKIFEIAIFNDLMGKRSWKGGKMAYGVSEFSTELEIKRNADTVDYTGLYIFICYAKANS